MRLNFKEIQKQYPDAIKTTLDILNASVDIPAISKMMSGYVLHNHISADGLKQTFITTSKVSPPPITVVYGPQGSGKTTKAKELVSQYHPYEVSTIYYSHIHDCILPFGASSCDVHCKPQTKIIIIEGAPITCQLPRLRIPYYSRKGIVVPTKIIVTMQGEPVLMNFFQEFAIDFIKMDHP